MTPARVDAPPPPVDVEWSGGGGSDWVELCKARNDIDAHLLIGRMTEAGIDTYAVKDKAAPWLYGASTPWAPVFVFVRRFQYEDARVLLAEISLEQAD